MGQIRFNTVTPPNRGTKGAETASMVSNDNLTVDVNDASERTPRPAAAVPVFHKTNSTSPRKQSVLTQLFHASEVESTDEAVLPPVPRRGLSAMSTYSNPSLTSDGMTSSDTRASTPSPPPPASVLETSLPPVMFNQKSFALRTTELSDTNDSIDPLQPKVSGEQNVEAGLGRKRCITFACGKKVTPVAETKAEVEKVEPAKAEVQPTERKCALRFICPTKIALKERPSQARRPSDGRKPSPAPAALKLSPRAMQRVRRASASPVNSTSPKSPRKSTSTSQLRRLRNQDDIDTTSTERACGYAGQRAEDDDWMKERTCYRSKLTVDDTLKIEKNLRHLAEEAEEEEENEIEAEEELDQKGLDDDRDDDDEDEDEDENEDEEADDDADDDEDNSEEVEDEADSGFGTDYTAHVIDMSDDGFQTDDEGGMGDSSDESDAESEFSWWAPGRSTAATSYEQLDHLHFTRQKNMSGSSIGSLSSVRAISGDRPDAETIRKTRKRRAIPIRPRVELPDSTDFVCGTLDEDRPLEDAYIQGIQQRRAAKHRVCPQDIDPTFPTSDPEMDEEDDEDLFVNHHETDEEADGVFGQFEEHDEASTYTASRGRQRPNKSPAMSPKRVHSPAPKRLHSPPPRRTAAHRSPAPPVKLFASSPRRFHSPPPTTRLRSPPPSRRGSIAKVAKGGDTSFHAVALAERPRGANLLSTSLPRRPNLLQRHRTFSPIPDVDNESGEERAPRPTRGALDIVKGLEKKRQLRKEKLYQKMCRQRAAEKGTKKEERRCLPGKGAERMREMGLELAGRWKGERKMGVPGATGNGAQHILSL